jgi:hypothetical protein
MFPQILVLGVVGIVVAWLFNPFMAYKNRSEKDLWKTNEKSHGWPHYFKMIHGNHQESENCDAEESCKGWPKEIQIKRPQKNILRSCNIIYVE